MDDKPIKENFEIDFGKDFSATVEDEKQVREIVEESVGKVVEFYGLNAFALDYVAKHSEDEAIRAKSRRASDWLRDAGIFVAQNRLEFIDVAMKSLKGISNKVRVDFALWDAVLKHWDKDKTKPTPRDLASIFESFSESLKAADNETKTFETPDLPLSLSAEDVSIFDSKKYYPFPSNVEASVWTEFFIHGERDNFDAMEKNVVSNQIKIGWGTQTGSDREVIWQSGQTILATRISNIDILASNTPGAITVLFEIALMQISALLAQIKNDGQYRDTVSITVSDLRRLGMYTTNKGAKNALAKARRVFKDFEVQALFRKQGHNIEEYTMLFPKSWIIDKKILVLKLSPFIPWPEYLNQFSYMPPYFARLETKRGTNLLRNIMIVARQRGKELREKGYFDIMLETVRKWLDLPDPKTAKNPMRDIKRRVVDILDDIEKKSREFGGEPKLGLISSDGRPLDINLPASEWIKGRLRVRLNGEIGLKLKSVDKTNRKKTLESIRETKKRKKITDKKKGSKTWTKKKREN